MAELATKYEERSTTIPASAVETSPAQAVDFEVLVPLLRQLGQLPAETTGSYSFGNAGAVLLERGRLCWAASPSMRRRLTNLLRAQQDPPLPMGALEETLRRCRRSGKPFGESLVAAGHTTPDGLRRALRQHTAEGLALLAVAGADLHSATWRPHKKLRYDAQFTFSATDLATTVGALRDVAVASEARDCLRDVLGGRGIGLAFSQRPEQRMPLPIGAVNADDLTIEEVLDLAEWAKTQLQVAACLSMNPTVASKWTGGVDCVVWQRQSLSFVMLCETSAHWARVLGHLQRWAEAQEIRMLNAVAHVSGPDVSGVRPAGKVH